MTFSSLRGLGASLILAAAIIATLGAPARAEEFKVTIDNFTFSPA